MISRDANSCGIVNRGMRADSQFTFMADRMIKDREEGGSLGAIFPVSFTVRLIPDFARLDQVVIFLAVIGAVVACFSKILRIHFDPRGHRQITSHMLCPQTCRIHASNNRCSRRSTNRRIRPAVLVLHADFCQRIDMRRRCIFVAITTKFRPIIFTGNPQNIGKLSRFDSLPIIWT